MHSLKTMIALALVAVVSTTMLSGCNTVAGAGRDVKSTGKAIENKAQEEKAEHRAEERAEERREKQH